MRRRNLTIRLFAIVCLTLAPATTLLAQQVPPIVQSASSRIGSTGQNPYLIGEYYQQDPVQDKNQDINQVPQAPQGNQDGVNGPGLEVQSNARNLIGGRRNWCNIPARPDRLFGCTQNGFCVGGWVQTGYHERTNGLFNSHPGRWNVHQSWFHVEKLADPSRGMNWGFRADAVYGVDAQNVQAFGNSPPAAPDNWDNSYDNGIYGWAIPQAFVEYSNGYASAKAGYFFSPMSKDRLTSVDNFFYSRTFVQTLTRPYTMTGGLVETNMGGTTLIGGVTTGWNSAFENIGNALTFVGGYRMQMANGIQVSSMFSFGDTGINGTGYANSSVIDVPLTDALSYSLQIDFYELDAFDDIAVTNEFILRPSRCLGLGTRLEYYRTDRFGGDMSTWGWTSGVNIRPHQNIIVRPEVRLDWGPAAATSGQANWAMDAIFMF